MKKYVCTIAKYLFSVILILITYVTTKEPKYILISLIELALIFLVSNLLIKVNKYFTVLNDVFLLLFNVETAVLYFGNSYVTYVMLENTDSISALRGNTVEYVIAITAVLVFSFLPVRHLEIRKINGMIYNIIIFIAVILEAVLFIIAGNCYSPLGGMYSLGIQWREHYEMRKTIESLEAYVSENKDTGYGQADDNSKQEKAKSDKNVILIFTEGLSEHVITDSRNIMPNVAALKSQSISFSNYYNHTFATYRGLQGTLYSGYQFENYDINNMTSIMDIMKKNGYSTAMINTEPNNEEFGEYLANMGFDEIITDTSYENDILDKQAYEMLYDTAVEYENSGEPYFLAIYTFGTHVSFGAPLDGVVFVEDYMSDELNKFYNADYQFGIFFDKFKNSPLSEDTILVFTADHATYVDDAYKTAFPDSERNSGSCDEIPFYIYDNGAVENIDAQGRNSLDMVPTLLDYLGLNGSSDFLGSSLFSSENTTIDTFFWEPGSVYYTGADTVSEADEEMKNMVTKTVTEYCSRARQ